MSRRGSYPRATTGRPGSRSPCCGTPTRGSGKRTTRANVLGPRHGGQVPLRAILRPTVARRRTHALGADRNRRARPPHSCGVALERPSAPCTSRRRSTKHCWTARVDFLYGCYATDVLHDASGNLCGIVMANRAGRQAVVAKTIIDATDRAWVRGSAGDEFRPYPAGLQTFHRVVIGGEPRTGPGHRRAEGGASLRGAAK